MRGAFGLGSAFRLACRGAGVSRSLAARAQLFVDRSHLLFERCKGARLGVHPISLARWAVDNLDEGFLAGLVLDLQVSGREGLGGVADFRWRGFFVVRVGLRDND